MKIRYKSKFIKYSRTGEVPYFRFAGKWHQETGPACENEYGWYWYLGNELICRDYKR